MADDISVEQWGSPRGSARGSRKLGPGTHRAKVLAGGRDLPHHCGEPMRFAFGLPERAPVDGIGPVKPADDEHRAWACRRCAHREPRAGIGNGRPPSRLRGLKYEERASEA